MGLLQGSEVENPDAAMTRKPDDAEPFSGLAFKIMADPFVGTLTFVRIYRCSAHLLNHDQRLHACLNERNWALQERLHAVCRAACRQGFIRHAAGGFLSRQHLTIH